MDILSFALGIAVAFFLVSVWYVSKPKIWVVTLRCVNEDDAYDFARQLSHSTVNHPIDVRELLDE